MILSLIPGCLGDTATTADCRVENPCDDNIGAYEAVRQSGRFGPALRVTSIGNVTGSYCPDNTSPYLMYVDFLKNNLENTRQDTGESDQTILERTAEALGLSSLDIEKAIGEAGVTVGWSRGEAESPDTGYTEDLYLTVIMMALAAAFGCAAVVKLRKERDLPSSGNG